MASNRNARPLRVLLTVPHLTATASPYRQMYALASYLPRDEFELTICSLRENGYEKTGPGRFVHRRGPRAR